jgi:hypothetical protein
VFEPEHRDRYEAWLAGELRRPVPVGADGPQRVMSRVRRAAASAKRRSDGRPAAAFAFAACVVGIFAFRMAGLLVPTVGDSRAADGAAEIRDTISSLRDSMQGTARLVSVIAPAAARIAIAHDFHGWDLHFTPGTSRTERATHSAALRLAPDLHLYPVTQPGLADSTPANLTTDSMPERR